MRGLGAWACAGWLAVAGVASARVVVEDAGLTQEQVAATHALVDAADQRLPPGLIERLGRPVSLRWRDDLPDDVHGRVQAGRIALPRRLLDDWMHDGMREAAASPALSALLHELAHVHDRSAGGGLSRDPRLLDLAGWPVRPLRFGRRVARNDFSDRSPDAYELHSPAEFVAVNLEHFLLDPEYACRRPALHAHFAAHFDWAPPAVPCAPGLPFVGPGPDEDVVRLVDLDPARVHEVHYLLAEADARPMSRWGHGMLRLVVCAPGRAPGEACRYDLDHHLVLSFRAFVDDVQVSNWRGLTGSYPSRLFVLPLQQVVDEYTRVELRGLQSIPLQLARDEIDGLLARAAQVHWGYDGRYYFVSNNCAVEAWKLLHDGVPRLSGLPLRSITPNGLLRRLAREGVADASVLEDTGRAEREGYRFASQGEHFQAMLEVANAELALPVRDARAWLDTEPAMRTPWLAHGGTRATAALLLLEQAALRREQAAAREALKQRFLRGRGDDTDLMQAAQAVRELLGNGAHAGRPALLLAEGYGVPQADEREALARAVDRDRRRLDVLHASLQADARALVAPRLRARLEATEANLALLSARLRMLSRDEGAGTTHPH